MHFICIGCGLTVIRLFEWIDHFTTLKFTIKFNYELLPLILMPMNRCEVIEMTLLSFSFDKFLASLSSSYLSLSLSLSFSAEMSVAG